MTVHFTQSAKSTTPIFALHSSASNGGQWTALTEAFQFERSVEAPNLPGYGQVSGRINPAAAGMARLASPIIDQIEAHQVPVHLVGHDWTVTNALRCLVHAYSLPVVFCKKKLLCRIRITMKLLDVMPELGDELIQFLLEPVDC